MITNEVRSQLDRIRAQVHSNCTVCSPWNSQGLGLAFGLLDDGSVLAEFYCDAAFEGYANVLHGGVIASLLDGAMTNCMFAHGHPAVTAELITRFRHPVVTRELASVCAWIDQSSPPLYLLKAELVQDGQVKATARGKFMDRPGPTVGGSASR